MKIEDKLTQDLEESSGSDGRIAGGGSNLTLVLGIVDHRGSAYLEKEWNEGKFSLINKSKSWD